MATLAELEAEARACTCCALARSRTKVVFGTGNPAARLVLVGEGPGRDEDLAGEPFVGRSGKLLDRLLAEELGIDRRHCYIANVVKCRPPNNRDPEPGEVAACRRFLDAQLALIRPAVVVALGAVAARTLLRTTEGVRALRGRSYPLGTAQLVPTYHPAAALRGGPEVVAEMRADLVRAKRLLLAASRPARPHATRAPAGGPPVTDAGTVPSTRSTEAVRPGVAEGWPREGRAR